MMERILLGVFFLSGWFVLPTRLYHYHFVNDKKTWTEAQTYCRDTYTDLATIENTEDVNQLINTVSSAGYKSYVWIGLYSNVDWRWSDGYRGPGADYRKWNTITDNEPNCWSGNQFCVEIGKNGWHDDYCLHNYQFICYKRTPLDPEYIYVKEAMTWSNAQRFCREKYIDLATVTNDAENQKIQNLVQGRAYVWIGLFRHPDIYWSDGSNSSFRNWAGGANPFGNASKICGIADLRRSGKWWIIPCESRLPFVCYSSPPVKRQIFKLKMKMDSSADPNDPAVKAELLKKLQDRLEEKGVSGVTLKWREQPDGKVFHKEEKRSEEEKREKHEL